MYQLESADDRYGVDEDGNEPGDDDYEYDFDGSIDISVTFSRVGKKWTIDEVDFSLGS